MRFTSLAGVVADLLGYASLVGAGVLVGILVFSDALGPALAQDGGAAPATWVLFWNAVFAAAAPILTIVIGGILVSLRKKIGAWFGAEAELAVNKSYALMLRAGAGELRRHIAAAGDLSAFDKFVDDTLAYLEASYGAELIAAEPRAVIRRADLLAEFNVLKP